MKCLVVYLRQVQNSGGFNRYNCNHYNISPIEGSVLLFPSNLRHGKKLQLRIVIVGDIRVTLKPEHFRHHQGCTHPSQWLEI